MSGALCGELATAEAERRCAGRLSIDGFRHISRRLETEEYQTLALPSRSKLPIWVGTIVRRSYDLESVRGFRQRREQAPVNPQENCERRLEEAMPDVHSDSQR